MARSSLKIYYKIIANFYEGPTFANDNILTYNNKVVGKQVDLANCNTDHQTPIPITNTICFKKASLDRQIGICKPQNKSFPFVDATILRINSFNRCISVTMLKNQAKGKNKLYVH